jgi:hypothetical protein
MFVGDPLISRAVFPLFKRAVAGDDELSPASVNRLRFPATAPPGGRRTKEKWLGKLKLALTVSKVTGPEAKKLKRPEPGPETNTLTFVTEFVDESKANEPVAVIPPLNVHVRQIEGDRRSRSTGGDDCKKRRKADSQGPVVAATTRAIQWIPMSRLFWYVLVLVASLSAQVPAVLKPGTLKVNPNDGQKYVWIPPGVFTMGCGDSGCLDVEFPHQVTISRGFWIGQTTVTVAAYKQYVRESGEPMPPEPKFGRGRRALNPGFKDEQQPIVDVTWLEAKAYCAWAGGNLPSEAEVEYAARAGETVRILSRTSLPKGISRLKALHMYERSTPRMRARAGTLRLRASFQAQRYK